LSKKLNPREVPGLMQSPAETAEFFLLRQKRRTGPSIIAVVNNRCKSDRLIVRRTFSLTPIFPRQ